MKFLSTCVLVISIVLLSVNSEKVRYDNYRVYTLKMETIAQLDATRSLEKHGYMYWNEPPTGLNELVDIIVPPHKYADFDEFTSNLRIESVLKIKDIQKLIDMEQPKIQTRAFSWDSYYDYDEIYAWCDEQVQAYPDILSMEVIGYTTGGLQIRAYKLSHKENDAGILIEANIHAREWITSATATYVLNELLTSDDPDVVEMATNINWYFIPVMNVDGLTYTHTYNRLWRKSRKLHSTICYGVDLNRNFGFMWGTIGASDNPCDETYRGPVPFSDPESQAVADYFERNMANINVYLAFHSYGQYVLSPFGYTNVTVDNYAELVEIGTVMADAIYETHGTTRYTVGSTALVLYYNSGSSRDWVRGQHNLPVSYTIEFRDTGTYGFVLPADQIVPNALEIMNALKAMVPKCRELEYL